MLIPFLGCDTMWMWGILVIPEVSAASIYRNKVCEQIGLHKGSRLGFVLIWEGTHARMELTPTISHC
jgi:hypothetical protein